MYRGHSNPSLRNSSREDDQDRDTLFSMSGEARHPLPPLPGTETENNRHSQGSGSGSGLNSNNAGSNVAGLGAGTPLPPSLYRGPPPMSQIQEGQRISIVGPPQSTSTSSTPPLPPPPPPALTRSRTVGSRPFSDLTRVPPHGNRSDSSSMEKSPLDDQPMSPSGRELDLGLHQGSPIEINLTIPEGNDNGAGRGRELRARPTASRSNTGRGIDWIVPDATVRAPNPPRPPSPRGPRTVEERLEPTIKHAREEERKSSKKAQVTSYALNIAIGLQVVISALITGLSAAVKNPQVITSILGGAGTLVASYLARARGSNEPELSISRVKDLQRYIRECEAFVQDYGLETGHEHDERIDRLREEFEHLLGNGNGERKLSNLASNA